MKHTYYDFFAGGGMAGFGLAADWQCLFANDIDTKKAESYRANHHGGPELRLRKQDLKVSGMKTPSRKSLQRLRRPSAR